MRLATWITRYRSVRLKIKLLEILFTMRSPLTISSNVLLGLPLSLFAKLKTILSTILTDVSSDLCESTVFTYIVVWFVNHDSKISLTVQNLNCDSMSLFLNINGIKCMILNLIHQNWFVHNFREMISVAASFLKETISS